MDNTINSTGINPVKLSILILDDEPIVCKRLKPAFLKAGYEVETYTTSADAMERILGKKLVKSKTI